MKKIGLVRWDTLDRGMHQMGTMAKPDVSGKIRPPNSLEKYCSFSNSIRRRLFSVHHHSFSNRPSIGVFLVCSAAVGIVSLNIRI